ncbi:carbonic anhydrase [Methanococcus maripaludis]|uniref:Carbonic anhydrase n=2 Tax=Methanococcus maripaludis TaxID=39152 RepID=A0A7J9PAA5_METMI|nr:carbonic anhydrase [Methanococcus maripaludis]MBA2839918.1 carbonic anhydrase [Methanococcus maripaludis]MBA2859636.1 carbonic anhydrase [Methanococcus maripaludis]
MGENAKPKKKLAIVTCMDTRLVNFLSEKLGIAQGDAKVIKNAGNIITEDVIRSLVVAVYLLGVEDVMIIGHTDCGMAAADFEIVKKKMVERGANPNFTPDFEAWLGRMYCEETNVKEGVELLRNHPAMPKDITIDGYVMDIETGDLVKIA